MRGRITREAQLSSAPPNWRSYLVRTWVNPFPPPDDLRPRSKQKVEYWDKWVAEGWGKGERQAVEIFLSDLGRLGATWWAWRVTACCCAPTWSSPRV